MLLSYIRTVILYLVLIFGVRLMGKRQIGQMEASEFVVTMLIANLASIPMQDGGIPLFSGLVPILTVLGVELVLSGLMLRSIRLRRLLCGSPVMLIREGRILQSNLRSTRITLDELAGHLREKDVADVRQVQYAILETDGNLSVFPYPQPGPPEPVTLPVTVIADGHLYRENLARLGRDDRWLEKVLGEHRAEVESTFLLTAEPEGKVYFVRREEGK